ncbi:AMP-dependent synthetase/ligase [Gordonia polyisoprenivorans]|uniref:AMP-dependent synthetase/ligase n=1 Tax=Gordonia polyisoprenivorans TaxID=84595 RepID=UPI000B99DCDF|nr:AMP-dependent synthetase/ligase [Gordonia polyisoprenivorans]OZC29591.1 long-chain fatty acid--CoA ligase [Gordonia polyisoprenivorans]
MSQSTDTRTPQAAPGVAAATIPAAFQATVADRGDRLALHDFGTGKSLSWNDYARIVAEVAAGLADLGIGRGDTVAIMLPNCPEFHIIDMATLHLGATPFSIYLTSAPEQISYLFDNAENTVLVTESRFLPAIGAAAAPRLAHVVVVDSVDGNDAVGAARVSTLDELRSRRPDGFDFESTWGAVRSDDVATLIYTSGTTGDPKGVELTHANLMFVMHTCNLRFPFAVEGAAISYLPTAHAADRVFSHYLATATGWPITTVANASSVFAAVAETHPSWFLGVPRIWEKLRASLLAKFDALPDGSRETTLAAVDAAIEKVRIEQRQEEVPGDLADRVAEADAEILAPLRTQLGFDRVALLMTGAAPIAPAVHEFFLALGLPLQEGFGMSETGALGFTNLPTDIRIGKVGIAQPGTEAKLADDGELLLRGPHVMKGYRKTPEKTAEAIDSHGWLHTGDIAVIDDDGWVSIVDRKKELIINAAGKNMSPANIEGTLKSASPLIGQACVIGDRRPYNVALLVLDPDSARTFATQRGRADAALSDLVDDPELKQLIAEAVEQANARLSRVEQIKAYRLLDAEWLPDSEELTPTMKLKRRGVASKYEGLIEEIYEQSAR